MELDILRNTDLLKYLYSLQGRIGKVMLATNCPSNEAFLHLYFYRQHQLTSKCFITAFFLGTHTKVHQCLYKGYEIRKTVNIKYQENMPFKLT